MGVSDSIQVEIMGLLEGLRILKIKGIRDCIVEGILCLSLLG